MKSIIFEGLDGSGKTTLKKEFERRNNHFYACFDRFPSISSYVYDKFYNRFQDDHMRKWWLDTMLLKMRGINTNLVMVHVDTVPWICFERRDKEDENYTLVDLKKQQKFYREVMSRLKVWKIPVFVVDGERDPIWNSLTITDWLKELEEKSYGL